MKFLCLCYYDSKKFEALTQADFAEIDRECRPRDEALRKSGHLVTVGSLDLPASARTLRPAEGAPSVADGPYARSDEPIGAFFILEARDLNEAVEVASLHPGAHLGRLLGGGIEVRACDHFQPA